jgi:hypothetical protein
VRKFLIEAFHHNKENAIWFNTYILQKNKQVKKWIQIKRKENSC